MKRGLKAGLVWVKVAMEGGEDGEEVEGGEEVAARRGRAVDGEVDVEEGERGGMGGLGAGLLTW